MTVAMAHWLNITGLLINALAALVINTTRLRIPTWMTKELDVRVQDIWDTEGLSLAWRWR